MKSNLKTSELCEANLNDKEQHTSNTISTRYILTKQSCDRNLHALNLNIFKKFVWPIIEFIINHDLYTVKC